MWITNLISESRVCYCSEELNKKRALEKLAKLISDDIDIDNKELFKAFMERERLGSTAIGHGIAIPHIRSEHVKKPLGALLQLKEPIDFDSADHLPVDIIFALVVPMQATEEHLNILAELAKLFSQRKFTDSIRECNNNHMVYNYVLNYVETCSQT